MILLISFLLPMGCQASIPATQPLNLSGAQSVLPFQTNKQLEETPSIFKRQNGKYLLAYQASQGKDSQIYVKASTDGSQWSTAVQITQHDHTSTTPQLIEDKDQTLHLFYASNHSGYWMLYQTSSKDGINWNPTQKVQLPQQQITNPSILYHNNQFILVYQSFGGGVFTSLSKDSKFWSMPLMIDDTGEAPSISLDSNNRFVVTFETADDKGWNIYTMTSKNLSNWSQPQALTQFNRARWGKLIRNNNNIVLLFSAETPAGNWELHARQTNDGINWNPTQQLTKNGKSNLHASFLPLQQNQGLMAWEMRDLETDQPQLMLAKFKIN